MILVSVIISCYNESDNIYRCLHSIVSQSYKNLEVIIVDDCSTDDTVQIIDRFILDHDYVSFVFIKFSSNCGVGVAKNECLKYARGEFIAVMDADDIMFPNRILRQVEYLNNNPSVSILGGGQLMSMKNGKFVKNLPFQNFNLIKSSLFMRCTMLHPTIMFRKSFMVSNQIWYSTKHASASDYLIFINFLFAGAIFANLKEIVNTYNYEGNKDWDIPSGNSLEVLRGIWIENLKKMGLTANENDLVLLHKINSLSTNLTFYDLYKSFIFFLKCSFSNTSLFGGKFVFILARTKDFLSLFKRILTIKISNL
jgi:glycosyltransferase involved in cell wall biosynthesis